MENKLYIIKCVDYKSGSKEDIIVLNKKFTNFEEAEKFARYLKTLIQPMSVELINGLFDIGFRLSDIQESKTWLLYHYVEIWDSNSNECIAYTEDI